MRIAHIRNSSKRPIATVATEFEKDVLKFGLSICSPADEWNRDRGREIAIGRLEKHPIVVPVGEATGRNINKVLFETIAKDTLLPRRLRKIARELVKKLQQPKE